MKTLEKYQNTLDKLDYSIVRLFEQRMCTVKKIAGYYKLHDLLPRKRRKKALPIVERTTSMACDTEVIAYTEGLIIFLLNSGDKFYKKCLKR